jgi:predicted  nucleic acid-binding Zn-ribbon protein
MPGPGPILREIHRLRRHIKDLEGKIENGPRQLKAQQNKIAKDDDNLKKAHEALKQSKVNIHDKEVSIKATEAEIQKYEQQLSQITTKKEYDTLRAEIASAKGRIAKIEDQILDLMLVSDEKARAIPEAEAAVKKAKDDVAQFERDLGERLTRFKGEKEQAQEELKKIEATMPEDIKPVYDRLIASKFEDCIAAVEGGTCSACYTGTTPQMANDLRRGAFVLCKTCGRMLYAPEAQ